MGTSVPGRGHRMLPILERVHLYLVSRCLFVVSRWIKSPFLVSRSLFWYRDSAFCSSTSRSFLPGINLCALFWALTSCKSEVQEDLDTPKKDISIPTERVTRFYMAGVVMAPLSKKLSRDLVAKHPTTKMPRLWREDPHAKSFISQLFSHAYLWLVGNFLGSISLTSHSST